MTYYHTALTPSRVEDYFLPPDVHEQAHVQKDDQVLVLVLSFIWTILHGINAYITLWGHVPLGVGVLFHLILTAILGFITMGRYKLDRETRFGVVLFLMSAVAGVIGSLGSLLASLQVLYYNQRSKPFFDWYQDIFPELKTSRAQAIEEDLLSGRDDSVREYSVIPFMDVITLGTEAQKRQALARAAENFEPNFSPIFTKALQDPSNAIRVQAATSIAKIENRFSEMLMKIEKLEKERPDDLVVKKGLARYYDDYAFTGILDKDREEQNRTFALKKYRECLELSPTDIEARICAGRLMLRQKQYKEAADWFEQSYNQGIRDTQLRLWHLEALFASGQYDVLRRHAKECNDLINDVRQSRPQLAASMTYWANMPTTTTDSKEASS